MRAYKRRGRRARRHHANRREATQGARAKRACAHSRRGHTKAAHSRTFTTAYGGTQHELCPSLLVSLSGLLIRCSHRRAPSSPPLADDARRLNRAPPVDVPGRRVAGSKKRKRVSMMRRSQAAKARFLQLGSVLAGVRVRGCEKQQIKTAHPPAATHLGCSDSGRAFVVVKNHCFSTVTSTTQTTHFALRSLTAFATYFAISSSLRPIRPSRARRTRRVAFCTDSNAVLTRSGRAADNRSPLQVRGACDWCTKTPTQ
jgi:hypothetical protein